MAKGPQLTQRKIDKLRDALNVVRETDHVREFSPKMLVSVLESARWACFQLEDVLEETSPAP